MSEAMSSVEIEDVLSSIRRLVSEDLRPGLKAAAPAKVDEKLLLTSALRVVAEKVGKPVRLDPVRATPLPRLHLGAISNADELVFRLDKAVDAPDVEWESETGDPQPVLARMEWTEDGWAAVESPSEEAPSVAPASALAADHDVPAWAQTEPDQDAYYRRT